MAADGPVDVSIESLSAGARRADSLLEAGRAAEALEQWDRVLTQSSEVAGQQSAAISAMVLGRKAHLLLSLKRPVEAELAAGQAAQRLAAVPGADAQALYANALGVQRSALTELKRHDAALEIDQHLVDRYAGSEVFELKLYAARALRHEIWTYGHLRDEDRAVASAQRLAEVLGSDEDPEHLVEVVELLLSGAEMLNHRRIWRRASAQVTDQARAMCDQVLELAQRVGGDLGEAATVNARRTLTNALVQDHRLRASIK